jgi:ATP-dependent exoDNAse (exonuclease V) beta subunit
MLAINKMTTIPGSKSTLYPILEKKNKHERDVNIEFYEEGHIYKILTDPDSKYTSVTTYNHYHFPHFDTDKVIKNMMNGKNWKEGHKNWGMTAEEIKQSWNKNGAEASGAGTIMHFDIECFMNQELVDENNNDLKYTHADLLEMYEEDLRDGKPELNTSEEFGFFLKFVKENPELTPYRTEWLIYNEDLKLSGSIDMVYENPDGSLKIYDWKRSKGITKTNGFDKYALTECISHLPDANFWHYSLQLNTYKAILEEKYGKKVTDLYLVVLHPNNTTYDLIPCADLSTEVSELFEERRKEINNL